MGMESQPVLVLLPDSTIRMYFVDNEEAEGGKCLTVGDVLREYPGHTLGKTSDPQRSTLAPWQRLRAGGTYHLARVDRWRPMDTWRPLPQLDLDLPSLTGCGGSSTSGDSLPLTDPSPSPLTMDHRKCTPGCAPLESSVLVKDWEACCVSQYAVAPSAPSPSPPAVPQPGELRSFYRAQSLSPSLAKCAPLPFPSPRPPHPPILPSPRAGRPPLHRHNSIGSRALESLRDAPGAPPPHHPPSDRGASKPPSPRGAPREHSQGVRFARRDADGTPRRYQLSVKSRGEVTRGVSREVTRVEGDGRKGEPHCPPGQPLLSRRHSMAGGPLLRELQMMYEEEEREARQEEPAVGWRNTRARDGRYHAGQGGGSSFTPLGKSSSLGTRLGALVGRGVRALVRRSSDPEGAEQRGGRNKERSMKRTVSDFKEELSSMQQETICGDLGKGVTSNQKKGESTWNWAPTGTYFMSGPHSFAAFTRSRNLQR